MHGITRIVIFCTLTTVLPVMLLVIPLYLRHSLYASVVYTVAESDVIEIEDGISTIFCSEHTLTMNTPFHAFQVPERPEVTSYRKHLRLKKSMTLPDDTLEYWGFYLLKGATVVLSVCSRFPGGSILVVKGERSLRTCGVMEHADQKVLNEENYLIMSKQVHVTVESNTQKMSRQSSMKNKKPNQTVSIPHSNSLLDSKNENQSTFRGKTNMGKSNDHDQMNPTNHPIRNSVSSLNLSQISNNTDLQIALLQKAAISHIQKHSTVRESTTQKGIDKLRHMRKKMNYINSKWDSKNETKISTSDGQKRKENELHPVDIDRKSVEKRDTHSLNKELFSEREERIRKLETELNSYSQGINIEDDGMDIENNNHHVNKRQPKAIEPSVLLDRGVEHGGNAFNFTSTGEDSSISSFENDLLTCYNGQILLTQEFDPSELCTNISFLVNSKRIHTQHNVVESGYYYYIFYSDNDYVSNDMHAIFDIYKPTYQFENVTESCINQTECSFSIELLSGDRVIVEIPTRNGIDREDNNMTLLTSTCYPRVGMYTVFPIAVLLFILGCAFL